MAEAAAPAPASPALGLGRRNIYILPTGHGLAYGAMLVVTLIGAMNYDNSLAFSFTFLLASVGLVSMFHAYRNLAGLRVQVSAPDPVCAGASAQFLVRIDNCGGRARAGIELSQGRTAGRPAAARPSPHTAVALGVDAGEVAHARLPVPALRRGWLWPHRMRVSTRVPLGLFRAWTPVDSDGPCLVYPRSAGAQAMPGPREAGDPASSASQASGDDDFAGLRSYRPGDSPRRIHWRAAARGGPPPVKEFDSPLADRWEFDFDEILARDPEDRLCQLAAWVHEAHQQGLCFGVRLPGTRVAAGQGPGQLHRCLRALATHAVEPSPSTQ